eukprot:1159868-Pelagomonas_calceolata.AAC.3
MAAGLRAAGPTCPIPTGPPVMGMERHSRANSVVHKHESAMCDVILQYRSTCDVAQAQISHSAAGAAVLTGRPNPVGMPLAVWVWKATSCKKCSSLSCLDPSSAL